VKKVKYIKIEVGQAKKRRWVSLRTWLARLNVWAVAWYAFLMVAGILLYKLGAAYALRERGYYAVGGEGLALLLPVFYYCAAATIRDIVRDVKDRGEMSCKRKKRPARKPPANATAWCALHERLMNDVYIRRRGCVMRRCKHLKWLNGEGRKHDGYPVNGSK
jgi:hypothetical protein